MSHPDTEAEIEGGSTPTETETDAETACPHDNEFCEGPEGEVLPCWQCFAGDCLDENTDDEDN